MSKHKKFSELRAKMSPEAQRRVNDRAQNILGGMVVPYHTCGKQSAATASAVPLDPAPRVPCIACSLPPQETNRGGRRPARVRAQGSRPRPVRHSQE